MNLLALYIQRVLIFLYNCYMTNLTSRQSKYLILITQEYIATGSPVGSSHLIKRFQLETSSATIRNEMAILEKGGFLEKAHTSSGRIPSEKGFTYYAQKMKEEDLSDDIKVKLRDIFAKRTVAIDTVLEEAAEAISSITNLTLVTKSDQIDELLKSIQFVPLNEKNATIIVVTSSGRVESKLISVESKVQLEDVRIAVRILKDRLIDTPLKNLASKTETLSNLIAKEIKNYEFVIQQMVSKVFDFHTKKSSNVYGRTNIIKHQQFHDPKKLLSIMEQLEKTSIWESIEKQAEDDDQTLKISIQNDQALISKKITINNSTKEISIVGSDRMQYEQALPILNYLEELVKGGK